MARRSFCSLAILLAFLPFPVRAADVSRTSAQFLELPFSVRAAAMGEAFTAVSDDASAIVDNIAGLTRLDDPEINLLHASQWDGLNDEFLGAALPVGSGTAVGLGAILNHLASFNSTNDPSAQSGSDSDFSLEGGVARKFGPALSFGLGFKYLKSRLADVQSSGFGLDAGFQADLWRRYLTLGLALQNLGSMSGYGASGTKENLPTTYRAGLAGRPWDGSRFRALLSVEVKKTIYEDPVFQSGAEIGWGPLQRCVLLRAGYQSNSLLKDLGGAAGFSFGAGIRYSSLQFDYALIPYGDLGNTQRFSMTYRFTRAAPAPEAGKGPAEKPVQVAVQSELSDVKTGTVKAATFEIKPQARTGIQNWSLDITDSKGVVVRRYEGKGVPPRSLVWDGKDAAGQVVTGGVFSSYQLRTIDKKGGQVVAADPVFDLNAGGVDLRGMDPRVLAMRPAAAGSVQPSAPSASRETAPVLTEMPQPQGRRGSIRLPAILFEARSSVLRDLYRPYLDQVADLIRKFPRVQVYIEGHADAEGTPWEAVKLSQERADAVLRYLLEEKHLSPEYLYARGHGQSAPLESEPTEKAHAMNRRVEIVILTQ